LWDVSQILEIFCSTTGGSRRRRRVSRIVGVGFC
jgi:hypothetical protein